MTEPWLAGKVALVTGGGTGIGRSVVERFVAEGAQVGVLDRSEKGVAELNGLEGVTATQGDARSLADNERAVAETVERFGRVDALVTCAGIFDYFVSLADLEPERLEAAFAEVMGVNTLGTLNAAKAALPELDKAQGSIVLTISNAGFLPGGGGPLYTASKFAVRGIMTQLAFELAPRVRVNAVAPGGTVTPLKGAEALGSQSAALVDVRDIEEMIRATNPLQVVSQPEDHAWAYVYLASKERTKSVTGCVIHSDGGLAARGLTRLSDGLVPG